MNITVKHIKELITNTDNILVISHSSPDPDAISSAYVTYKLLKENYPQKNVYINIEKLDTVKQLSSYIDMSPITQIDTRELIKKHNIQLIICMDIGNSRMFSIKDQAELSGKSVIQEFVESGKKVVCIDHHNEADLKELSIYINYRHSSCVQSIYTLFISDMGLREYDGIINHLLLGVISDTGGLQFFESNVRSTLEFVTMLVERGGSIDEVKSNIERLSLPIAKVLSELLQNAKCTGEMSYTYVSDDFFEKNSDIPDTVYSSATKVYAAEFSKRIGTANWGFVVKKSPTGRYSISLRSVTGKNSRDVSKIAKRFEGGGRLTTAGGIVNANNVLEAVDKVITVIKDEFGTL